LLDRLAAMPRHPTPQAALGTAAKQRREELDLTQEALALAGDLHQRWVSNVENGWRNPSYASLRRLAAALDLTTSQLIARAEQIEAGDTEAISDNAR
jgi:transcriptional regulator with XRE-family HTH domain